MKAPVPKQQCQMAVLTILLLFSACKAQAPVIYSIHPQIGYMGEPVIIKGAFFGDERLESYVTIAGIQPTGTSYIEWKDDEISFRPPVFGEAGLVYVFVNGIKSNGILFANQATVPRQIPENTTGLGPRISSVTPQTGSIGTLVNIQGTGFGASRGNSGVFFSWNAQPSISAPADIKIQEYIEAVEFDYDLWSEREIHIRIPDGAASGNMEIRSARGSSPPVFYEMTGRPGTKSFQDKRTYTISYSVNVRTREAHTPNAVYLWIPQPAKSASQRNIILLSSNVPPFIEEYRGASLYKLNDMPAFSEAQINQSWKIEVYSVETSIRPEAVRQEAASPVYEMYTQEAPLLPSNDPRIKEITASITGRERNPYIKAKKIYDWILQEEFLWQQQADEDIFSMLETKQADPYLAVLLYCSMLRSAGIPCLPIAGVMVNNNQQSINHYWAEFWLDGFGWVPVDPAMGAGAVPALHNSAQDAADYYFGNTDCRRIAFSRGITTLSPMDSRGRVLARNRSYSLQNFWEEVIGGIESYSSLWGDITITGIYSQ